MSISPSLYLTTCPSACLREINGSLNEMFSMKPGLNAGMLQRIKQLRKYVLRPSLCQSVSPRRINGR